MPADAPIACTLTAAEVPERMAQIAALGADALTSAQLTGAHAVLRFQNGAATRERLADIVAAEATCCAFLAMRLDDEDDAVVLTIDGPPETEPVLGDLVAAFESSTGVAP